MTEHYDVLVVGAGPAGLAAAHAAASHGARVGLVDAQARPGGQVWRHDAVHGTPRVASRAINASVGTRMPVTWLARHQVIAAQSQRLCAETPLGAVELSFGRLVIATGARELLLPFPGWTLPGVTGAGGLQALAKQGWPVRGKRVVVAGSGPLLWAAAASLRRHGALVLGIHEQASAAAMRAFALQLWRWPGRVVQALQLRAALHDVAHHCGSFVRSADGDAALTSVRITSGGTSTRVDCDLLAVGHGLVPNVALAGMLGCAMDRDGAHPVVQVDELLRTSVANIHAAGESCGIAGLPAACIEGRIAGHMAAGATAAATSLLRQRRHARRFGELLGRHFSLDPRLYALAEHDTIICRCEDVTLGALDGYTDARAARLATRCGMGACQGRVCGTALAEMGRFPRSDCRLPIFPARLATLADRALSTFLSPDSGDNHP